MMKMIDNENMYDDGNFRMMMMMMMMMMMTMNLLLIG